MKRFMVYGSWFMVGVWIMVFGSWFMLFTSSALAAEPERFIAPDLQVQIPGLSFVDTVTIGTGTNGCDDGYICVNTIETYLNALYRWGAGAGAIFAIVLIMIGGVEWMVGSAIGTIEKGKQRIKNASFGLILVMVTTVFLQFINPNITSLQPVRLEYIEPLAYVNASGDTAANAPALAVLVTATEAVAEAQEEASIPATDTGQGTTIANMSRIGLSCPKTGGSDAVAAIARQFVGKTTYRLGGKGNQTPPFVWELPPNRSESTIKKDSQGTPYGYYCPDDTMCLDCSGFVQLVSTCAGLAPRSPGAGTAAIFRNAPHIINCDPETETVTLDDNSEHVLVPGDWLGFGTESLPSPLTNGYGQSLEKAPNYGHIWIYVGEGKLSNSAGGGRPKGKGVREQALGGVCTNYPLQLRAIGT